MLTIQVITDQLTNRGLENLGQVFGGLNDNESEIKYNSETDTITIDSALNPVLTFRRLADFFEQIEDES